MPRQSWQRLPVERRARILAVAAEEFAEHGYHGTSYNRLLARLGLGKSSAYHYFEDKADLFRAAVADCYADFFESVAELPEPTSADEFWDFILDVNVRGFRFMLDDPTAAALMQCLLAEAGNLDQVLAADEILGAVALHHERIIALGQRLGAVRADLPIERLSLLSRSISSTADQAFVAEVRADGAAVVAHRVRDIAAEWTDALRRLLEPPARRPMARRSKK